MGKLILMDAILTSWTGIFFKDLHKWHHGSYIDNSSWDHHFILSHLHKAINRSMIFYQRHILMKPGWLWQWTTLEATALSCISKSGSLFGCFRSFVSSEWCSTGHFPPQLNDKNYNASYLSITFRRTTDPDAVFYFVR